MSDGWEPAKPFKSRSVDPFDPSFPWRDGRPDWNRYNVEKSEARTERARRRPKKSPEYSRLICSASDPNGPYALCPVKAEGMLEMNINGVKKLVPLCGKHKTLFNNNNHL